MAPFVAALESYHALTEPSTWSEAVVKAYVGDGMAADFYREVAAYADDETGHLIREVVTEEGRAQFAVAEVRAAIAERPAAAGRLALWARRLVRRGDQPDAARAGRPRLADAAPGAGDG